MTASLLWKLLKTLLTQKVLKTDKNPTRSLKHDKTWKNEAETEKFGHVKQVEQLMSSSGLTTSFSALAVLMKPHFGFVTDHQTSRTRAEPQQNPPDPASPAGTDTLPLPQWAPQERRVVTHRARLCAASGGQREQSVDRHRGAHLEARSKLNTCGLNRDAPPPAAHATSLRRLLLHSRLLGNAHFRRMVLSHLLN